MFNSKKGGQSTFEGGFSINSIGINSVFEGNITTEQDIRIDGQLIGNLNCQSRLIVGEKGKIQGEVTCSSALIQGVLEGKLKVNDTLEVSETGSIDGSISTQKLIVHEGAHFNVECKMSSIGTKS